MTNNNLIKFDNATIREDAITAVQVFPWCEAGTTAPSWLDVRVFIAGMHFVERFPPSDKVQAYSRAADIVLLMETHAQK